MRWSKLKQQTESMFADEVRGRVELWTTRYSKARHRLYGLGGRSWITIDGEPIVNMHSHLLVDGVFSDGHPKRFEVGIFAGWDLPMAAKEYLSLSIDDAFRSENTLIRALAVLDRRAGRRRLAKLDAAKEIPPVATLLAFRLEAASIRAGA